MTPQEYKAKRRAMEQERRTLAKDVERLDRDFIALSPLKIGDKVRVWRDKTQVEVFISAVYSCEATHMGAASPDPDYRYAFAKIKKDGTMSGQSARIHSVSRIELIEKAAAL